MSENTPYVRYACVHTILALLRFSRRVRRTCSVLLVLAGVLAVAAMARAGTTDAVPVLHDDFEHGNTSGWILHGPGSTADEGAWIIGDPIGTVNDDDGQTAQPEDAYQGSGCALTGQNPDHLLGKWDVDRGVTYLVSPVLDLSAFGSAELRYVRWFNNRDVGEDHGDYFVVQARDSAASAWIELERLDYFTQANWWTQKSFFLEDYISLTSTVQFRFGAADAPLGNGNIIEALIDNVEVLGAGQCSADPQCDDGLFCNGVETCVGQFCEPGSFPCTDPQSPVCDEAGDRCVICMVDADCPEGHYCGAGPACVAYGQGDCDDDGDVDLADFQRFQACFERSGVGPCAVCNLTGGVAVDGSDFEAFIAMLAGPAKRRAVENNDRLLGSTIR